MFFMDKKNSLREMTTSQQWSLRRDSEKLFECVTIHGRRGENESFYIYYLSRGCILCECR